MLGIIIGGVMHNPRTCLLWAIYLIGGGLLLGGLLGSGLVAAPKGQAVLSPWLWALARLLLVLSWLSMGAAVHGSHVEDYHRAPRGRLTTRYHGYIVGDKSDEGQDASLRVEMGNPK